MKKASKPGGSASSTKRVVAKKKSAPMKSAARKSSSKSSATKTSRKSSGDASPWAAAFAPRSPGERRYWLVKSEPDVFSFDDLLAAPNRTTFWDGVRNFAARNFLRDGMKLGDQVFFYHSMANPQAIVGVCEVVREGYPDSSALDPKHEYFDADSDPSAPTWFMVDLCAVDRLPRPVTLPEIKAKKELGQMALIRIGRLSVTPVTTAEWGVIRSMAEASTP